MERGTDRERDAVRERWRSMEARRRGTDRFLLGLQGILVGTVLLFLAVSREVCGTTIGGATTDCTATGTQVGMTVLGVVGVLALGFGVWACWDGLT